jgi:hypothetical protein
MINWHNRYAKLLRRNPELFDPGRSLLEVGSGLQGVALWLQRPVVGLEPRWDGAPNPLIEPVAGDVADLPFGDASFDFVVCVDVLEHLTADTRRSAISELVRVARERVIVACPCGDVALQGELAFSDLLRSLDIPSPEWLTEHLGYGLPELGDIVDGFIDSGYAFDVSGNENRLQHYAGLLLDMTLPVASEWNALHAVKTVLEPPIGESPWDQYYSYLFTLDKTRLRADGPRPPKLRSVTNHSAKPSSAMYAVVHDPLTIRDAGQVRYIPAGQAKAPSSPATGSEVFGDADGLPNERWSELSAIYSVWKDGPVTDVVGFCHYRRFFNFSAPIESERQQTIDESMIDRVKNDFTCPDLLEDISKGLIVLAKPIDLGMPVFDHYSQGHNANDYLAMFTIVAESAPWLLPFLAEDFTSSRMYINNMFLMSWQHFDAISSLWFPVLLEFCARVDGNRAGRYQNRDVSFLSERLFSALIKYAVSQGVQIREQPVYFVEFPQSTRPPAAFPTANAHESGITVGARLRAALEALEAEETRTRLLFEKIGAEEANGQILLQRIQAEEAKTRQLEEILASVRASDAWRLAEWLKRSRLVRSSYRTVRAFQKRLRRD